jgi:hypothetical protein
VMGALGTIKCMCGHIKREGSCIDNNSSTMWAACCGAADVC